MNFIMDFDALCSRANAAVALDLYLIIFLFVYFYLFIHFLSFFSFLFGSDIPVYKTVPLIYYYTP